MPFSFTVFVNTLLEKNIFLVGPCSFSHPPSCRGTAIHTRNNNAVYAVHAFIITKTKLLYLDCLVHSNKNANTLTCFHENPRRPTNILYRASETPVLFMHVLVTCKSDIHTKSRLKKIKNKK